MRKAITSVFMVFLILASVLAVGSVTAPAHERVPVIVGFKGKADAGLIRAHGGDVKYEYGMVSAVACSLPQGAIDALNRNPKIAYIEPDGKVQITQETLPWGVDRIDAEAVHQYNKGMGVKVAIIDTGIDYNHPDLDANYKGGYDFVEGDGDPMDDAGHGTHCAGIVAAEDNEIGVIGVAPEAELYAVKVLDSKGSGYVSDVIAGIDWATINGMQIISMSLGSNSDYEALHSACDAAYEAGVLIVAAAGNDYRGRGKVEFDTVDYPARYDSVIAVGATDDTDTKASWSSTVDITPPEQVIGVAVTTVSSSKLDVSWTAESDLDHYNVYRSTASGGPYDLVASPIMNSYSDTGLMASTTYYYIVSAVDKAGNEGLASFEESGTTSEAPALPTMHIASIDMSLKTAGINTNAIATVTIVDASGKPVEGATVYGQWDIATTDSDSGITDASGQVSLDSDKVKRAAPKTTFKFVVEDVVLSGWDYDFSENVETEDEITV